MEFRCPLRGARRMRCSEQLEFRSPPINLTVDQLDPTQGVAQSGRVPRLECGGRGFKSHHPDQLIPAVSVMGECRVGNGFVPIGHAALQCLDYIDGRSRKLGRMGQELQQLPSAMLLSRVVDVRHW